MDETGWGAPEHLWVMRAVRIDVVSPPREDDWVELVTWCSGTAALAAGRRLSLAGDRGGRVEVDSVWIHLGPDARPARIEGFGVYAESTGGRAVSTRLGLVGPGPDGDATPWTLRTTDIDLLGHVNNAAYWAAVEECLGEYGPDPRRPLRALLDYRHPIDLGEDVRLRTASRDRALEVAFAVGELAKAVARVEPIG